MAAEGAADRPLHWQQGNIIQPALFHDSDGNVRMVARHRGYASSPSSTFQKGHVVVAKSHRWVRAGRLLWR